MRDLCGQGEVHHDPPLQVNRQLIMEVLLPALVGNYDTPSKPYGQEGSFGNYFSNNVLNAL